MARLSGRWSRATALAHWAELGGMVRRPLLVGLALTALWPCGAFVLNQSGYRDPRVAGLMLLASVIIPLAVCWRGPSGIGPVVSVLSMAVMVAVTVALGREVLGDGRDGTHWIYSWGMAVMVVLAFARPAEEIVAGTICLLLGNLVALHDWRDSQTLHALPMTLGGGLPAVVCAFVLVSALRAHVSASRQERDAAEAVEQRRAIADAIQRERSTHFTCWEATAAPVLEDLAAGRRTPDDPEVAAECAALARLLRAELANSSDSLLEVVLRGEFEQVRLRGGSVIINDHDVGYRIGREQRMELVDLLRSLCAQPVVGEIQLALLHAGGADATAVMSVEGFEMPDTDAWRDITRRGTLTVESRSRWWWDCGLICEAAPAFAYRTGGASGR